MTQVFNETVSVSVLFLACPSAVPTTSVTIYDKDLKPVDKVAGPFDEGTNDSLICDANEGIWPAI